MDGCARDPMERALEHFGFAILDFGFGFSIQNQQSKIQNRSSSPAVRRDVSPTGPAVALEECFA